MILCIVDTHGRTFKVKFVFGFLFTLNGRTMYEPCGMGVWVCVGGVVVVFVC